MKRYPSEGKPLLTLNNMRDKINIRPDYQRSFVWGKSNKGSYVDTIVRDEYSPEVIFAVPHDEPSYEREVLDGQQRLTTILQFMANEIKVDKNTLIQIDGETYDISDKYYSELPQKIKDRVDGYPLNIVLLDGTRLEYEKMFKKLQNGVALNEAERRHAISGEVQRVVKKIIQHPFFAEVCEVKNGKANNRKQYNEVIEQILLLELFGITNIKKPNINKMYDDYNEIGVPEEKVIRLGKIFDYMYQAFTVPVRYKRTYFKKTSLHGLYLVLNDYIKQDPEMKNTEKFGNWFINFENNRKTESDSNEMYQAYNNMSSGTGNKEFLIGRKEILMKSWNEWLKNDNGSLPGMFKNYNVEDKEDKVANG